MRRAWASRPVRWPAWARSTRVPRNDAGNPFEGLGNRAARVKLGSQVHDPPAILAAVLVGEGRDRRGQRHAALGRDGQNVEQ